MPLFRRKDVAGADEGGTEDVLYVHLAPDGGIFVVWGDTGREAWITQAALREELERIKASDGLVLYSRETPDGDPQEMVDETFHIIADQDLPMKLVDEPHLVEAGADVNARGTHGVTPLGFARQNGHDEAAAVLEAAGAGE
jgi:hypothetical protein